MPGLNRSFSTRPEAELPPEKKVQGKTNDLKIGIYAGSGTSHSWLWFVDLFERAGCYDLVFLDEFRVQEDRIADLDVLVVSGGDTFAVAGSLGKEGAGRIESFVRAGGLYIGSCAGAYLPMKSSKSPLDHFNFVDVKITNLSKTLPLAEIQTCKFCSAYGCDFVFHPVRDDVVLKTMPAREGSADTFDAPLYGGPGMRAADPAWVRAVYAGFTPKTSFLTNRKIAEDTLLGNAAIVRVPYGAGFFYLLGPHLEHPKFPRANQFIMDALARETRLNRADKAGIPGRKGQLTGVKARELVRSIRRELSNSRIVASSLEFMPVQWLIGDKVYEPQKVRVYLESLWKRLRVLERSKVLAAEPGLGERITSAAIRTTMELRRIKRQIDEKQDSLETAVIIFDLLHVLAISFFELYFSTLAGSRAALNSDGQESRETPPFP